MIGVVAIVLVAAGLWLGFDRTTHAPAQPEPQALEPTLPADPTAPRAPEPRTEAADPEPTLHRVYRRQAEPTAATADTASLSPAARERAEMVQLARLMLVNAIDEHLPAHRLSNEEIEELAESTVRLREAQSEWRELPFEPEYAKVRKALLEQIEQANASFARIMNMSPAEFTNAVQPDVGVDSYDPNEVVPPGEFIDEQAQYPGAGVDPTPGDDGTVPIPGPPPPFDQEIIE